MFGRASETSIEGSAPTEPRLSSMEKISSALKNESWRSAGRVGSMKYSSPFWIRSLSQSNISWCLINIRRLRGTPSQSFLHLKRISHMFASSARSGKPPAPSGSGVSAAGGASAGGRAGGAGCRMTGPGWAFETGAPGRTGASSAKQESRAHTLPQAGGLTSRGLAPRRVFAAKSFMLWHKFRRGWRPQPPASQGDAPDWRPRRPRLDEACREHAETSGLSCE